MPSLDIVTHTQKLIEDTERQIADLRARDVAKTTERDNDELRRLIDYRDHLRKLLPRM